MPSVKLLSPLALAVFILVVLFSGATQQSMAANREMAQHKPTDVITVCGNGPPDCDYGIIADAIQAAENGDTIEIGAGTYDEHAIIITKTLSIIGAGSENTIIQTAESSITDTERVFAIMPGAAVLIRDVMIQNSAAYTTGIGGYGGGIFINQGVLTLTNSTVHDCQARMGGGGIYITATAGTTAALTLIRSTIYGNSTDGRGGGIALNSDPGSTVQFEIINSTIGENVGEQSGGGLYLNMRTNDKINITQTTIYKNSSQTGKNIHLANGKLTLTQNVLAGGSGGDACQNDNGTVIDGGFNLIEDGSCDLPIGGNPGLSNLANNGGGILTYKPLTNSPVLDAVPIQRCAANTDQRGLPRPFGAGCDIGSVELDEIELSFEQRINNQLFPGIRLDPEQYITITLKVAPVGAGFTDGVITATIPPEFNVLVDQNDNPRIFLDPPGAGVLGTLPILAHDIVITANHQLTATIYAQVATNIPGETQLFQAFSFTCTEITTPTIITGTPTINNVPPVARNDQCPLTNRKCTEYSTPFFANFVTGDVLANDSDPNGDTIQYIGIDLSNTRGIVTYNGNGTFTYDPAGRFDDEPLGITPDTFAYTIQDNHGGQAIAIVTINIIHAPTYIFLPIIVR